MLSKWIKITRFLEELTEPRTASTTDPNKKRAIWDYANAFQEILERIFEEDFAGSGFLINDCADLGYFDPSALGIALFFHRLLLQDPLTKKFYYNVLTLPRIVYISVCKGWDSLTEDVMNWSMYQEISCCSSLLMINIHTDVSDNEKSSEKNNFLNSEIESISGNNPLSSSNKIPFIPLNSSDTGVPYHPSHRRLNSYHINVSEHASAQEIIRIFERIVDPMVRQFNPIMAVFNHDFSIHKPEQQRLSADQQQNQKLSPKEFASILQSIGLTCNHKMLVVSNLKLSAQEISEFSQLPSSPPISQQNAEKNTAETSNKKRKKQNSKQIKEGEVNPLKKRRKKNSTQELIENLDKKMLDIPNPDNIVVTYKAKQLVFDILHLKERKTQIKESDKKTPNMSSEIQASLEAKYTEQILKVKTELQELQKGNSIDILIRRQPSGTQPIQPPFQLIHIANPKTIAIEQFLRQELSVNSQNQIYPAVLYLVNNQFSFDEAVSIISIDHNYISQMIVATGYALTEEVNVSFSNLRLNNKLTLLQDSNQLNLEGIIESFFKEDNLEKDIICEVKQEVVEQSASNSEGVPGIRLENEDNTNTHRNSSNNLQRNDTTSSSSSNIAQVIERISEKMKVRAIKLKYACKIKQSKYMTRLESEEDLLPRMLGSQDITLNSTSNNQLFLSKEKKEFRNESTQRETQNFQESNRQQQEIQRKLLSIKERAHLILKKKLQMSNPLSSSVFDLRRNRRVFLRDADNGQLIFFHQDNQILILYNKHSHKQSPDDMLPTSDQNENSTSDYCGIGEDSDNTCVSNESENNNNKKEGEEQEEYLLEIYIFNAQIQGKRFHLVLNELQSSNSKSTLLSHPIFKVTKIIPTCAIHFGSGLAYDKENVYKILGKSVSAHSTLPVIEIINRSTKIITSMYSQGVLMPSAVQGFSSAIVYSPLSTKKYITVYGGYGINGNAVIQTALLELNLLSFRCCQILNKTDFFQYQLSLSKQLQGDSKKEYGNQILNGRTTPNPTKSLWSAFPQVFPNSTSYYDMSADTLYVFGGITHWEQHVCVVKITKVMEFSSMKQVLFTKYELDQSAELDPNYVNEQKLLFKPIFSNFVESPGSLQRDPYCVEPLNLKFTTNNILQKCHNLNKNDFQTNQPTIIQFASPAIASGEIQQVFTVEFKNLGHVDPLPTINIHMKAS